MSAYALLVTLSPGPVFRFSTKPMILSDTVNSAVYQYVGALQIDGDLPVVGEDGSSYSISIPIGALDHRVLRSNGITLGGCEAEIALIQEDATRWEDRIVLLVGRVMPTSERRSSEGIELEIAAAEQLLDGPLPPWIIQENSFGIESVPGSTKGRPIPVIRGRLTEVPLLALYDASDPPEAGLPRDLLYVLCGHSIGSNTVLVKLDGDADFTYQADLQTMTDAKSGATATMVIIPASIAQGAASYTAEAVGPRNGIGTVIEGLGDVILDIIRNYARVPEDRIDYPRFSRFSYRANRIVVASMFGGDTGSLAIQTLQSRYGGFPISISWRGGKIGADWLGFDQDAPVTRTLTLDADLLDRLDPVIADGDDIAFSEFQVAYDYNINRETFRKVLKADRDTNEICRRAYSRFGTVTYPDIQLVDVNSDQAARAVLDAIVDIHAVNRTRVQYLGRLEDFIQFPLFDRFDITDADMQWTAQPFRLETIQPRLDGLCVATFRSFKDTAYT